VLPAGDGGHLRGFAGVEGPHGQDDFVLITRQQGGGSGAYTFPLRRGGGGQFFEVAENGRGRLTIDRHDFIARLDLARDGSRRRGDNVLVLDPGRQDRRTPLRLHSGIRNVAVAVVQPEPPSIPPN
jgi:hypothetical protein